MRLVYVLLGLLPVLHPVVSHAAAPRTNFVLCMTDDQGWGDTGYNGNPVQIGRAHV